MLSRVAENLYWLGRYIERAEDTARIVNVNANLLLDLPAGIAPGWRPIIDSTGYLEQYLEIYGDFDERHAVRFLVSDPASPSSILASLGNVRENARTIRDYMPREFFELVNELYLYARDNAQAGISKRGRYDYLKRVILGSQCLAGMVAGTMSHDAGYEFLRTGRLLERADMTSRIIDVRSSNLLPEDTAALRPYETIQWISVLKSLTAYQMYRQRIRTRVRRADALRFLLQDDQLPRAFYRAVSQVEASVTCLPRAEAVLRETGRIRRQVQSADVDKLTESSLHEFMDSLQIGLSRVHDALVETYFRVQDVRLPDSGAVAAVTAAPSD